MAIKMKKGIMRWTNGNQEGDEYQGEFKDDLRDGKGIHKWSDGKIYNGEWNNGLKHGQGKMVLIDVEWKGDVYVG